MAWVKVPPENHPLFRAALPADPRVETVEMFGGVAAKVNGNLFAGLFGRSTMVRLDDADKAAALALEGASLFDPMGDGRARSDKVMLPERFMTNPSELGRWIRRAFEAAASLPKKVKKKETNEKQTKKPRSAVKTTRAPKREGKQRPGKGATPTRSGRKGGRHGH